MASTATGKSGRTDALIIVLAILTGLRIWLDRQWPGSLPAVLTGYAFTAFFLAWFGSRIWIGYRRRSPHWTGASWRRYLRLAAVPLAAVIVFLALAYLFDARRSLFGSPESTLRVLFILFELALMLLGVVGFGMVLDWLTRGEPSEQFTRTRWFRRRGGSAIAD